MAAVERVGQFIEFTGENGQRCLARVTAVALATDADECHDSTHVTVANRTILVMVPLDEFREALLDDRPRLRGL